MDFPHLINNPPNFPTAGRELYEQIEGAFDYTLWKEGTKLTLTRVPWGPYEAGRSDSVPGFSTTDERDAWLSSWCAGEQAETHELDTMVRYKLDSWVDLPFPFDNAFTYNYLIVDYPTPPVANGIASRYLFFLTDVSYKSPNCTRVALSCDWWTTFSPLMGIKQMQLTRGHAPVAATSVADYLKDPINNSKYLLAPDIDFAGSERLSASKDYVFNDGTTYVVIAFKSLIFAESMASYAMPYTNFYDRWGCLSTPQFAVAASEWSTFVNAWQANAPQLVQGIECVFYAPGKFLDLQGGFSLWDCTVYQFNAKSIEHTFTLEQSDFGFDDKAKDFAKLYTWPYSHLEYTDERGNVTEIRIEELSGNGLTVSTLLNVAFPTLSFDAIPLNVGGSNRRTLAFSTVGSNLREVGGKWYELAKTWDIPTFALYQVNEITAGYRKHFIYEQQENDASTAQSDANALAYAAYQNALATNATNEANADRNASVVTANAANSANTTTANAAVVAAANTATTATSVANSSSAAIESNSVASANTSSDNALCTANYEAVQDGLAVAATNNGLNAIGGLVSGVASVIAGDVAGGLGSMASTAINYATSANSNAVSQSNSTAVYSATVKANSAKTAWAQGYTNVCTSLSNDNATANMATMNSANTSVAANTASMVRSNAANTAGAMTANASATHSTGDANAQRTYDASTGNASRDYSNALNAIANSKKTDALQAPNTFGTYAHTEYAATRPMVQSVQVVRESDASIAQAAAGFARYGYALNQIWDFTGWNVMKNFSFWQADYIVASAANKVPEAAQTAIREMLYNGVTAWKDPANIGSVSVYDN